MKRQAWSFTLIEMLVVLAIVSLLAGMLLPALMRSREHGRQSVCRNNLGQIGKACIAYQGDNGDFFPAFEQAMLTGETNSSLPASGQGADGTFQPMPSLACLYPSYVPDVKVFACPSTTDVPLIAFQYYYFNPSTGSYSSTSSSNTTYAVLHTCFGFVSYDARTGALLPNVPDPAAYTSQEVSTINKCSYLYDELCNPRDVSADQAMAADADGQTWLLPNGQHPGYANGWQRAPTPHKPNHDNGQNVMYLDGHVKLTDIVTCSHDPNDNIFCPDSTGGVQWNADIDSYLWDGAGGDARAVKY
jgi:prepilin-type N-terminal cleavage/methylation domain-containing protein/prepilin-type processing-associated H-X9-DG protein